jgi:Ala-tRNA(Pro) deacylase
MATATKIRQFLDERHVRYDMTTHAPTATTLDAASSAHVEPDALAKAVMLGDEAGCLMAVLPASHNLKLAEVRRVTGRNHLHLLPEGEFARMFPDCQLGAVPPLGRAYGIETVWDDCLGEQSDIYFESGDHRSLTHVSAHDFVDMVRDSRHGCFSKHR